MNKDLNIYVAGHRGMAGSAIVRHLIASGHPEPHIITRTHADLDLTNQAAVNEFFATEKPDQVYLAAAKVGGIHANNTYPAEFIYQNLMIEANIIDAAYRNGVEKLLFSVPAVSIPNWPSSQCGKMHCLLAPLSRRTNLTP